jgi:hypothetical protein
MKGNFGQDQQDRNDGYILFKTGLALSIEIPLSPIPKRNRREVYN